MLSTKKKKRKQQKKEKKKQAKKEAKKKFFLLSLATPVIFFLIFNNLPPVFVSREPVGRGRYLPSEKTQFLKTKITSKCGKKKNPTFFLESFFFAKKGIFYTLSKCRNGL